MKNKIALLALAACLSLTSQASATQLILNGGFESGLSGWTNLEQPGSNGNWYALTTPSTPSGHSTVGAASGTHYAVSDQNGPTVAALLQTFSVSPSSTVTLSFDMFLNNWYSVVSNDGTLNLNSGNQFARVDILSAGSPAFNATSGVVSNLAIGNQPLLQTNPYQHYSFDITGAVGAGGDYQLRFAEDDTLFFYNMGIDNVSIEAVSAAPVPEPSTIFLLGAGLAGVACLRRRKV